MYVDILRVLTPLLERHWFIEPVLTRFGAARRGRAGIGLLLRDIERMTRLSRQPLTWLARPYRKDGTLSNRHRPPKHGFTRRITATDGVNPIGTTPPFEPCPKFSFEPVCSA
jgi:hypothetical protein